MKYGVEIVIATIVLILIIIVAGYILRKRYYKEVDRLEAKKMELMHRPVIEELAKMKQLNMTGEAEKLFEGWRKSWDEIVTEKLPTIDEWLFDAEEMTDKYRFNQAKAVHEKIERLLEEIGEQIEQILDQLTELVGSEEKSRLEMEDILEKYKIAKKNLLAHRHSFGIATKKLDGLLEETSTNIEAFDELTNQGDYLKAREIVLTLGEQMDQLTGKMEKIPDLLTECQTIIPAQINELQDGYEEMKQAGFILDHLQIETQVEKIEKQLEAYREFLQNAEVGEVENGLGEMTEKLDSLYDVLEKEVLEKHYLVKENEKAGMILEQLKEVNLGIVTETNEVKNSYHLLEDDLEAPKSFEKTLAQLTQRYELLKARMSEERSAYSVLSEELKEIEKQLEAMQVQQAEFTERLQSLRKDELEAREKLEGLQRRINEIIRMVRKSKMPGLPADFESLYEQAEENIDDVYKSLNEKPLNMKSVQKFLYEAIDTVEHLYTRTDEHIENSRLAEKVIQYGNRYRARNPELRAKLEEAEQAFRNYEYKSALEQAATAVEQVEPGALKRIEEIMNEKIHV
ncbi:septation ring formation regulator EzrA [Bacillus sp. FJAT-50079]|uniref:septation ring formation regulator EzrA n=1 Tax=Bacillus sp. FJAT-50079 TaxID=2833577 RepID=UPI001BC97984|nr:septation ring formation regulator EzrA [Bacillus sp. FJAT-50079]MBS4208745.1 septation ring formation regulator EzrA [Bacillus sp. FJAT-50079]